MQRYFWLGLLFAVSTGFVSAVIANTTPLSPRGTAQAGCQCSGCDGDVCTCEICKCANCDCGPARSLKASRSCCAVKPVQAVRPAARMSLADTCVCDGDGSVCTCDACACAECAR